jgi:hypothetical protein
VPLRSSADGTSGPPSVTGMPPSRLMNSPCSGDANLLTLDIGQRGQLLAQNPDRRAATRDARTDEDSSPVARRRSHIADLPCCEKIEPYPPLQSDGTMQGRVLVEVIVRHALLAGMKPTGKGSWLAQIGRRCGHASSIKVSTSRSGRISYGIRLSRFAILPFSRGSFSIGYREAGSQPTR